MYCWRSSGIIELTNGSVTTTIDTYSITPAFKTVELKKDASIGLICFLIGLLLWLLGTWALYWSFISGFWIKRNTQNMTPPPTGYNNGRDTSIDLLKALAAVLVILVHSFLCNGYYTTQMVGKRMFVQTVLRSFALTCVPLFILLSGCVCLHRTSVTKTLRSLFAPMFSFLIVMSTYLLLAKSFFDQAVTFRGSGQRVSSMI